MTTASPKPFTYAEKDDLRLNNAAISSAQVHEFINPFWFVAVINSVFTFVFVDAKSLNSCLIVFVWLFLEMGEMSNAHSWIQEFIKYRQIRHPHCFWHCHHRCYHLYHQCQHHCQHCLIKSQIDAFKSAGFAPATVTYNHEILPS